MSLLNGLKLGPASALSLSSLQSGSSLPLSSSQSGTHYVPQKESSFRLLSLLSLPPSPFLCGANHADADFVNAVACFGNPAISPDRVAFAFLGRRKEFVHQIPSASKEKDLSRYPGPSCDSQAKYVKLRSIVHVPDNKKKVET